MDDVYKAPESVLSEPVGDSDGNFYVVSKRKFWILYLCTFGFYELYWFYKHWAIYKQRTHSNLWPIARSFFAIFFTHALFNKFERRVGAARGTSLRPIATLFVVFSIVDRIQARIIQSIEVPWFVDVLSFSLIPVICFLLSKGQEVANLASGDEFEKTNDRLTPLNWIWILLGLSYWIYIVHSYLVYYGVVLPR